MARRTALLALTLATALASTAVPAQAAWQELVGGDSPINVSATGNAGGVSSAAIGGVPHVAWVEQGAGGYKLWVSRLNGAGTDWELVAGGNSANHAADKSALLPSLTGINGVPYVAWMEGDGVNNEIRAARVNAAGTGWEKLVGGDSPINHSPTRNATDPDIADVGGVPHVTWIEHDGTNFEVRVSMLNGAATDWEEIAGGISPVNASASKTATDPDLFAIGGNPHVAWAEAGDGASLQIHVAKLNPPGTGFRELRQGTDTSPINHDPDGYATEPSLGAIDGVPYVAWTELDSDGGPRQIRASRFNPPDATWHEIVGGASPINNASENEAHSPSLVAIAGTAYIAWAENDSVNSDIRVGRLNGAGTAWEQIVGGASPINHAPDRTGSIPSLNAIGGVPYIGWMEQDGVNFEARMSRLEPEFSDSAAIATDTGASLLTQVHAYGIPYPVGFEYGDGFSTTTPTTDTSGETDTIIQAVGGLTPSTAYTARPFATAGVALPRVFGDPFDFTTAEAGQSQPTPPQGGPGGPGAQKLLLALTADRLRRRAGQRVRAKYLITTPAKLILKIFSRRTGKRVIRKRGDADAAGNGSIVWDGHKRNGRVPKRGRYRLVLTATGTDGQKAEDSIPLKLRKPRQP